MAFAGGGVNTPSARESAPGGRFFFFALLSLVLMYFDQKDGWGRHIRYALQAIAYPIQVTVGSPRMLWNASSDLLRTRASLREENAKLQQHERELILRTQTFDALEQENARLRGINGSVPALVSKSLLADVVNADLSRLRQRVVINKGDSAGLFRSQALVDATGVVGQLVRVGPWSSEVMLVTDPEAAVPVEVVRTGERTIATGIGDSHELRLPYLPATADVKAGDLLVTSGLGGVFPAGIPVGKVIENKRDPNDLLAHVRVQPLAQIDRAHQLLALWFDPASPGAPPTRQMLDNLPAAAIADPVTPDPSTKPKPAATAPATPAQPARAAPPAAVGPHPPVSRPTPRPATKPETTTPAANPSAAPEPQ